MHCCPGSSFAWLAAIAVLIATISAAPRTSNADGEPAFGAPIPLGEILPGSGFSDAVFSTSQSADIAEGGDLLLAVWQVRHQDGYHVVARRITHDGQPLDSSLLQISDEPFSNLAHPRVAYDGVRFLIVWQERVAGISDDYYRLLGRRIDADGAPLDLEPIVVVDVDTSLPYTHLNPEVAATNETFLVAWEDPRRLLTSHVDVYGALLDGTSGLVLPSDGFVISEQDEQHSDVSLASDGENFLAVWQKDEDTSAYSNEDIVAASIDASNGTVSAHVPVCDVPSVSNRSPKVAGSQGRYMVVWKDERATATYDGDTWGTLVDGSTLEVLEPDGAPILLDAQADNGPRDIAATGSDFTLLLTRSGCPSVLTDEVLTLGINGSDGTSLTDEPVRVWNDSSSTAISMAALSDNTAAVLGGHRYESRTQLILGNALIDGGGSPVPDGINISPGYNHQVSMDATHGDASHMVVWSDTRGIETDSSTDIYSMRIERNGTVLVPLDSEPLCISSAPEEDRDPVVASTGGRFLVVWRNRLDPGATGDQCTYNILAARVDEGTGALLDADPLLIAQTGGEHQAPLVAGLDGRLLVVWAAPYEDAIYGAMVDSYTGEVDDFGGAPLFNTGNGRDLSISAGHDAFWITWIDYRNSYQESYPGFPFNFPVTKHVDLYGGHVAAQTGEVPEPDGAALISGTLNADDAQLLTGADGHWLWWMEYDYFMFPFPELSGQYSANAAPGAFYDIDQPPPVTWTSMTKRALATTGMEHLSLWSPGSDTWYAARHLGVDGTQLDDPPLDVPIPEGVKPYGYYTVTGDPDGYAVFWIGPDSTQETMQLFGLAVSLPACVIGGEAFSSGEDWSEDGCLRCVPSADETGWTPLPEGTLCDDGDAWTTDDQCTADGLCVGTSGDPDAGSVEEDGGVEEPDAGGVEEPDAGGVEPLDTDSDTGGGQDVEIVGALSGSCMCGEAGLSSGHPRGLVATLIDSFLR